MAGSGGQKERSTRQASCAATKRADATGLISPLLSKRRGRGRISVQREIGVIRHLWRKHRLKLQLTLFGSPLAARLENIALPANAGRGGESS